MLCISRKVGESVLIGDDVEVIVRKSSDGIVRLAIKASTEVKIVRRELSLFLLDHKKGAETMNHTPGPWEFKRCTIGHPDNAKNPIVNGGGFHICRIFCTGSKMPGMSSLAPGDIEVAEANAKLIAAAPDLLAACKLMKFAFKHIPIPENNTDAAKDLWEARKSLIEAISNAEKQP